MSTSSIGEVMGKKIIIRVTDINKRDGWYGERECLIGGIFEYNPDAKAMWKGWKKGYLSIIEKPKLIGPKQEKFTIYHHRPNINLNNVYILGVQFEVLHKEDYPEYFL